MIAKLWFKCAAMHDPVCPKLLSPCLITWEAKYRDVQVVIERKFKGDELVRRMKGWVTVNPENVIEVVNKYGKFKINDNGELFVEIEDDENFGILKNELKEKFSDEIILESAGSGEI